MERAGIKTVDQDLRWPLITKWGRNDEGKTIRYYYNYSSTPRNFEYQHRPGTELIQNASISNGQNLVIQAWDILVIEEE